MANNLISRRQAVGVGTAALLSAPFFTFSASVPKKNILVLGGTNYFGPAVVHSAIRSGHSVTLFNRGITNVELFPGLERLRGDRSIGAENLDALKEDRQWDAVIDTWPDDPRMVEQTVELLKDRTRNYSFVSTIAVYEDMSAPDNTEDSPLRDVRNLSPNTPYRDKKVLCERVLQNLVPSKHLIVRPPGTFGERDESWSFVYWLWRIRNGGKILAPGDGDDWVQWVDVNDVADFIVHAINTDQTGIFNTIGPEKNPVTFSEFLTRANSHFGNRAELIWVDQEYLDFKELRPIADVPLWASRTSFPGRNTMSTQKAVDAGMTFRPMEQTFDDALNWYDQKKSPDDDPGLDKDRPFNGITRTRELELLKEWEAIRP